MGPGDHATATEQDNAYQLGKLIAQQGWGLLTGGRQAGVMNAASQGAKAAGGLTIGILPDNNTDRVSEAVDIAIVTGMGNARNNINVLSSDAIVACGMGVGTASEIALALKNGKKVILLTDEREAQQFFLSLSPENVFLATHPQAAIDLVKVILTS